ncbi:winged helix-turn-helix domain-containing protein [Variovorax paradoxus]|uniref:ATP-binding protein n=1 Tax=Variovorax paradoxus TaxID=34073 RepID=UPI00193273E9|nr:winged helix-turn-helix domain-containing protein [Variovorax paradoxus]
MDLKVADAASPDRWRFGRFELIAAERRLEHEGQPVRLGGRSIDVLVALVRCAGQPVTNAELLASIWGSGSGDEGKLRVHMSALRKALDGVDGRQGPTPWIVNIPMRGYQFTGAVSTGAREGVPKASSAAALVDQTPAEFARPPSRLTRLVGRQDEVARLAALTAENALVSVVGPGGMGKTTVAVHVAQERLRVAGSGSKYLAFVDFASLNSADFVLSAIAQALRAPLDDGRGTAAIIDRLADSDTLLIFDNCEHVIDALAGICSALLSALPRLSILVTSRQPLGVNGEFVFRLPALGLADEQPASLAEALRSPAIELMVDLATAAGAPAFADEHASLLARLCRRLDGIPLAIELVAARLGVQSLEDTDHHLADHIRLRSGRILASSARHRSLRATLDWSMDLLDAKEARLFSLLSVFRGPFDIAAAQAMAGDLMDADVAMRALLSLTTKSLVAFDRANPSAPYRLLDTTRAYAQDVLKAQGQWDVAVHAHAQLMLEAMATAAADLALVDGPLWLDRYAHRLDDVRFAIESCIAHTHGVALASLLTQASAPLWFRLSQVEEYRDRVMQSLDRLPAASDPDGHTEAALNIALYNALWHTGGAMTDMVLACERALGLALALNARLLEFQSRWGLCALCITRGEYQQALTHARLLHTFAQESRDATSLNLAHRMIALSAHFRGEFGLARQHAQMACDADRSIRQARGNQLQPDARLIAQAILARSLWISDDADHHAMAIAQQAVAEAEAGGHVLTICMVLFWVCPVAIWSGQWNTAGAWVTTMFRETQSRGLAYWHGWAQCYAFAVNLNASAQRDDMLERTAAIVADLDAPRREMMVTFDDRFLDADLVARAESGLGEWSAAEVWRVAGTRAEAGGDVQQASSMYYRALTTAESQEAGAWSRRARRALETLHSRPFG